MNTIVSDKFYIKNASSSLRNWCEQNLIITNPVWETLMRLGKQDQIMRRHILPKMALYVEKGLDLVIPFGCLYSIWKFIKDNPIEPNFNKMKNISCKNDVITQPLFDYQEKAVQEMVRAKGGVLVAPCSAGKTNIMIEIIHRIGLKFLFIVHTSDLLRQFYSRTKKLYPNLKLGTITDGKIDIGIDGAVATIQTLDKIDKDLYCNEFNVVVCDECAHVSGSPTLSKMFSRVVGNIPARYKFGCTATPERSDTLIKSMYAILGTNMLGEFKPVYEISKSQTRSLTAEHVKIETGTKFSYCFLGDDGTFDYNKLIDYLSYDEERNQIIVDLVLKETKINHKILILCHRIEHCKMLNDKLKTQQVKSVLLIGKVSNKQREAILTEKTDWEVIVGTYSLAKEGLDLPCLNTLIMATPINDKGMTIQCVGRVERFKEGKETPTVYDLCDEKIPYCVNRFKKRVSYLKRR